MIVLQVPIGKREHFIYETSTDAMGNLCWICAREFISRYFPEFDAFESNFSYLISKSIDSDAIKDGFKFVEFE